MDVVANRVNSLRFELGFSVIDAHTSVGEISGVLASLTLLSSEPLAIMVRLRLSPDADEPEVIQEIFEDIPAEAVRLTFEENCASISLYDIEDLPNEAIRVLLEKVVDAIAANDLTAPPGCLRCGAVEGAQVMLLENRPTRLCSVCLEGAKLEKEHIEREMNRATVGSFLGLPAVFASVVAGWAALWAIADWILDFFRVRVIWINVVTIGLTLLAVLGFGALLGAPLGTALRRSGVTRPSPLLTTIVFGLGAVICGELVYVTFLVFRFAGVVDLNAAVQVFQGVLQQYRAFWIVVKVALALAICVFCFGQAVNKQTARLDV